MRWGGRVIGGISNERQARNSSDGQEGVSRKTGRHQVVVLRWRASDILFLALTVLRLRHFGRPSKGLSWGEYYGTFIHT